MEVQLQALWEWWEDMEHERSHGVQSASVAAGRAHAGRLISRRRPDAARIAMPGLSQSCFDRAQTTRPACARPATGQVHCPTQRN